MVVTCPQNGHIVVLIERTEPEIKLEINSDSYKKYTPGSGYGEQSQAQK